MNIMKILYTHTAIAHTPLVLLKSDTLRLVLLCNMLLFLCSTIAQSQEYWTNNLHIYTEIQCQGVVNKGKDMIIAGREHWNSDTYAYLVSLSDGKKRDLAITESIYAVGAFDDTTIVTMGKNIRYFSAKDGKLIKTIPLNIPLVPSSDIKFPRLIRSSYNNDILVAGNGGMSCYDGNSGSLKYSDYTFKQNFRYPISPDFYVVSVSDDSITYTLTDSSRRNKNTIKLNKTRFGVSDILTFDSRILVETSDSILIYDIKQQRWVLGIKKRDSFTSRLCPIIDGEIVNTKILYYEYSSGVRTAHLLNSFTGQDIIVNQGTFSNYFSYTDCIFSTSYDLYWFGNGVNLSCPNDMPRQREYYNYYLAFNLNGEYVSRYPDRHITPLTYGEFSNNSQRFISVSNNGLIDGDDNYLWDRNDGRKIRWVNGIFLGFSSNDSRFAVARNDKDIVVIEDDTVEKVIRNQDMPNKELVNHRIGKDFSLSAYKRMLFVLNSKYEPIRKIDLSIMLSDADSVKSAFLSASSKDVLIITQSGKLLNIDITNSALTNQIILDSVPKNFVVSWSASGNRVIIGNTTNTNSSTIYDIPSGSMLRKIEPIGGAIFTTLQLTHDGNFVACGTIAGASIGTSYSYLLRLSDSVALCKSSLYYSLWSTNCAPSQSIWISNDGKEYLSYNAYSYDVYRNATCDDVTVTVDDNTSLNSEVLSAIYPQPADTYITCNYRGVLIDMYGRMVIEVKELGQVNISQLPSGIYFYRNENGVVQSVNIVR